MDTFIKFTTNSQLFVCSCLYIMIFLKTICYLSKWSHACNFAQVTIIKTLTFENWNFH